jgi:Domain of unknown function (DUF6916)
MTEPFTMETFSRQVNTRFSMRYGVSQTAELELTSVTDVGSSARQIQFSLLFQGPHDAPIAQGTYNLEHDELGILDMFLVPVGKNANGIEYEAIFNRAVE